MKTVKVNFWYSEQQKQAKKSRMASNKNHAFATPPMGGGRIGHWQNIYLEYN